jgi:hypothetical protein
MTEAMGEVSSGWPGYIQAGIAHTGPALGRTKLITRFLWINVKNTCHISA